MAVIDLRKTLKNYNSGWVSISPNHKRVITHAKSIQALVSKLEKLNNPEGYIMKASKDYSAYVGI